MSTDPDQPPLLTPTTHKGYIPGRYEIRPSILRAYRSKYAPHVGKKQMVKANARTRAAE